MRIANLAGRAVLLGTAAVDVATASEGRFGPDPMSIWPDWAAFREWAATVDVDAHPAAQPFELGDLEAPVPVPQQVFAIGLNYADHAAETGMALPSEPLVFTKFPSSLTGPEATVRLRGDRVDWEAELVVVIGEGGRDLPAGWDAVAGLTVGQDLSDRTVQNRGDRPQFGLGKSFAGYAPTGPAVVTVDEVGDGRDLGALRIGCRLTGPDGDAGAAGRHHRRHGLLGAGARRAALRDRRAAPRRPRSSPARRRASASAGSPRSSCSPVRCSSPRSRASAASARPSRPDARRPATTHPSRGTSGDARCACIPRHATATARR